MKLRRLKILKFRNVQPGTELEFNDGYNVLLGQNGSGKTTLLRLITSVLRGDFVWLEKETYALEAELEVEIGRLAFSIHHERKDRQNQPLQGLPAELRAFASMNERWSTRIRFHVVIDPGETLQLEVDDDEVTVSIPGQQKKPVTGIEVSFFQSLLLFSAAAACYAHYADHYPTNATTGRFLELLSQFLVLRSAFRFDESLDIFTAITNRAPPLGEEEYGTITGWFTATTEPSSGALDNSDNLTPGEIRNLEALKNPNLDSPVDHIVLKHDDVPFLAVFVQILGYVGAEIRLDLLGKEVTEDEKTIDYGNLRFFFHSRDGSIVNQDHLSYGQKRLLTFFYYLACNAYFVVADELVNGLHHAWIVACIRAMGDRQVFVTSQNPILLDHLGFDSAEHVHRTFITCQAKPEGVRDRITWANMSKKNADAFYRAYKVGAQHVGEILRTKGFW